MEQSVIMALRGQSVELEYCPSNRPAAEVFSINQQPVIWNCFGNTTILVLREVHADPTAPKETDVGDAVSYNFIFKLLTTAFITSVRASAPAHIKVCEGTWIKEDKLELFAHPKGRVGGHANAWSCRVWEMIEKSLVDLGFQDEPRPSPYALGFQEPEPIRFDGPVSIACPRCHQILSK